MSTKSISHLSHFGIGVVGAPLPDQDKINMSDRIVIIAGTSSCHMAASEGEVFVEGENHLFTRINDTVMISCCRAQSWPCMMVCA